MTFREFLNVEEMTSTGNVAGFSRIVMPHVRRNWPTDKKSKKPYRVPQIEEQSRWRSDANLRKIYDRQQGEKGNFGGMFDRLTRGSALQKVKADLTGDASLHGLEKWLDDLNYEENPDNKTRATLHSGRQPDHLFRGSMTLDGIHSGVYSNDKSNPILHGTPYTRSTGYYSGDTPQDWTDGKGDVFATRLPANPNSNQKGGSVIGRFHSNPDQRYARDPELEQGVKGETPEELVSRGETAPLDGGGETNLINNKFDQYVLHRERGFSNSKRKPNLAPLTTKQIDQTLKPNLRMI